MLHLRSALETLAMVVEAPGSLSTLIGELERGLSRACEPVAITLSTASEPAGEHQFAVPLKVDGDVIGSIFADAPGGTVAMEVVDVLRLLAAPVAAALASRRRPERRGKAGRSANVDALCRIANRRGFDERIADVWERAMERGVPVVVGLIDVDFFKVYNDRYGHLAGDQCLQQVASLLIKRRNGDDGFAARYGGEEFALIFEDTTLEKAVAEVQHIFERLATRRIEHTGTTLGRVSLSVGLASVVPTRHLAARELIDDADRALYQAKHFGRNRVCAGAFVSEGPVVAKVQARPRVRVAPKNPTFGRDDDLARILSALRYARMITLVGPRGIGKSRLLQLVADAAASRFHRPVVFLEAELLRAQMDPATALASACDLALEAGGALDTVTDFLDDREAVVIFDDIEPARPEIRTICSHLIARAPSVAIVAGAHAHLGLPAERSIVVAPLADEAAVEFLRFLGVGDSAPSRNLVRYLGGNPATIEAAAAAVARFGIAAVLTRLGAAGRACTDAADFAALMAQNADAGDEARFVTTP